MTRTATVAVFAAIAVAALGAGYYFGRDVGNEPAASGIAGVPAPKVPQVRPLFSLPDTEGHMRSIADWDGKALVINFWATWCPPCRREIPLLNALSGHLGPQGFQVVGVAVDFRKAVLDYEQRTPVDYPVLVGEEGGESVAQSFGMQELVFPFTVFTDQKGRIIAMHIGELHPQQAMLILGAVKQVMAGRIGVAAARDQIRAGLAAERAAGAALSAK